MWYRLKKSIPMCIVFKQTENQRKRENLERSLGGRDILLIRGKGYRL